MTSTRIGLFASRLGDSDPTASLAVVKRSGGCRASGGSAGGSLLRLVGCPCSEHPSWPFLEPYSALMPPSLVASASWHQFRAAGWLIFGCCCCCCCRSCC